MEISKKYVTPQEDFWAGDFGTDYIDRNKSKELLASNVKFFSNALKRAQEFSSCFELGANIGMNLRALMLLYPNIDCRAVEINALAAEVLLEFLDEERIFKGSIFDCPIEPQCDLVLAKTVLIHINPSMLRKVYEKMYRASNRYILICEYYSTAPVTVSYRGNEEFLFKRDFAGDMLDMYSNLSIVDYGFAYHRTPPYMDDDINWFLLEKRES